MALVAYFDCFAGISGDMLLGALIDAGWPPERLQATIRALNLPGVSATIQRVMVAKRFLPECGETSASLRRSYRQVVVLAERRLPEIGEDPVQASQGHG